MQLLKLKSPVYLCVFLNCIFPFSFLDLGSSLIVFICYLNKCKCSNFERLIQTTNRLFFISLYYTGEGVYRYTTGDIYKGSFYRHKRHGEGTFIRYVKAGTLYIYIYMTGDRQFLVFPLNSWIPKSRIQEM